MVFGIREASHTLAGQSASKMSQKAQVYGSFSFYWQQSLLSLPVLDVKRGINFTLIKYLFNKVKQKSIYKFSIKL